MTETLFTLTYKVARELGIVTEGIATGGSTSTIVDTNDRTEEADYWNKGSAWIINDAAGAGAAPQGEYSVIDDSTAAGTLTLRSTLTAAVAAGDRYAVCRKFGGTTAWLDIIKSKVNQALIDLGRVPYVDVTTLTTASQQTEYTLPIASKHDLRTVHIQKNSDLNDNQWEEVLNWGVEQSDPGVAPTLVLPCQYDAGYVLRLVYLAPHPELYAASDPLSEFVPAERVITPAALACLREIKARTGWRKYDDEINRMEQRVEQAKRDNPIKQKPQRPGRILLTGSTRGYYPGDRNPR